MSVNYDANYGIGYKVCESDMISGTAELEDGLHEYLCDKVGDGFEYFKVGDCYSGEMDGVFITIKEPFKNGLDLTQSKQMLDDEIKRLKLETDGEFNEVGGLYIW